MKKQRILAWALAASLVLSSAPVNAFAQDGDASDILVVDSTTSGSAVDVVEEEQQEEQEDILDSVTEGIVETDLEAQDDAAASTEIVQGQWTGGNSFNPTSPGYSISGYGTNASLSMNYANVGKASSTEDTFGYYVQPVLADADFTLSAKITINSLNTLTETTDGAAVSNPKQASLGLLVWNNLYCKQNEAGESVGDVVAHGVFNQLNVGASSAEFTAFARLSEKAATRTQGDVISDSIAAEGTNLGTFDLSITKSGSNYKIICGDKSYTFADELGVIKGDENGFIYPGVFIARNADITVTDLNLKIDTRKAIGLAITAEPTQKEYYYGQALNTDGLKVAVVYQDIETGEITNEEASVDNLAITGYDSKTIGTQEIKVSSGESTATFNVVVRPLKVTSITLKSAPVLNVYNIGALFSSAGVSVTAAYEDGTSAALKASEIAYTINGKTYDATTAIPAELVGAQTVEVSRAAEETIDPNGVSASYDITVKDSTIESISVGSEPGVISYYHGDEFNPDGLVIRGKYSDGTEANLQDTEYTLSGFNSAVGAPNPQEITVTYTANPALTTTFEIYMYSVEPTGISLANYPRTTYEVGEDFSRDGMNVVITYNNKTTTPAVEGTDYTIDLTSFDAGKNTPGQVEVTFNPVNTEFESITIPVTIKEVENHVWRGAIFGQSSGGVNNDDAEGNLTGGSSEVMASNPGTADGKITVKSWYGAGKITGDQDGIAYYYTTVSDDVNFSLTADVYVRAYLGSNSGPYNVDSTRNGQEAFGLMARDVIPFKSAADGSRTIYESEALVDQYGPVPLNTGTVLCSNMVIAGGYSGASWVPESDSSYAKKSQLNKINLVARTGVTDWVSGNPGAAGTTIGPKKISTTFPVAGIRTDENDKTTINLTGDTEVVPGGGDTYRITLKRINLDKDEAAGVVIRGLQATCTNLATGETMTENLDDAAINTMFTAQNEQVYVGFFAARWAIIDVSNVEFYTSNPMTDEVVDTYKEDAVLPTVSVSSSLYTTDEIYTLTVKTNNASGGYVTITQNGTIVYQDRKITATSTNVPLTLVPDSTNVVTLVYTPSKADYLTSYEPVTTTVNIVHKTSDSFGETDEDGNEIMYVSPNGSASGAGTREDPLDFNAALGFVTSGNTIIMLDGVYSCPQTITVSAAKSGRAGKISLLADEGANPIIDFELTSGGLNFAASYWHIKGISFTNCGANQHALNLGGNYNTIENCTFYNNAATGGQISRVGSSPNIEDWPSYNLILNCESYNNADPALDGADGFTAKLTVGYGNMFKGCISHHNSDDGWDLYTKTGSGAIGPVVVEDCISYKNGYKLNDDGTETPYGKGGHNGFKAGGENVAVKHYFKDCISFMNEAPGGTSGMGLSSNSNPAMKVRNFISYDNTMSGINLYCDVPARYDYDLKGIVSYKNGSTDKIGTYLNRDTDAENSSSVDLKEENSNYLIRTGSASTNNLGETVTDAFFLSVNPNDVLGSNGRYSRNADGTFNTGNFLKRAVPYVHDEADLVELPGVDGIHMNAYGDPNVVAVATTEAPTETTTKKPSSSGSGGGGSSSSSSSSSSSGGSSSSNADTSERGEAVHGSSTGTTTPSTPSTPSTPTTPSVPTGYKEFEVNGVKINVPAVDPNARINFTDKNDRAWATAAIEKLAAAGIINGISSSKFAPDAYSKRADFIIMLVRTLGLQGTAKSNFDDVDSSKYYANSVGLAKDAGIATGIGNNKFNPEGTITRQDMMVIVAKTLEFLGIDVDDDESVLDQFDDSSSISAYASPYVAVLVNAGIVTGTGSKIEPISNITRAQTAVIMSNVYDVVVELAEAAAAEEAEIEADEAEEEVSDEAVEEESASDEETSEETSEDVTVVSTVE